ncbi:tetratricopeptide repeat protein [Pseudobutyrivibrio sp. OR37]|uniref:tetratricopeptide repeat protein n=1 Tax=Pseudobutyrivibrio sp. OR37 TaxID=1798186 RepID=UPI000B82DAFB|nr:tetratricopeptide repeat protein [Pseudobutyrivibrio sp. OR37]
MRKKIILLLLTISMTTALVGCGKYNQTEIDLRDQGIEALDSGDYDNAIDLFNKALGKSIGKVTDLEIDINYYKAAAQFKGGHFKDAEKTYTYLIKYDKKNYEAYFLRGSIYANEGEVGEAITDYDAAVAIDEKNYLLYIQIYENLNSLGYTDQGLVYLNDALKVSDKSANGKYYKGRIYYMLGQTADATENLEAAIDKDVIEAKLYLAKIYQDAGDFDKAQKLLEEYASSDEVTSDAMAALGDIEMTNGNYESALSYYQAGLTLDSIDNMPALMKGQVAALEKLDRYSEAKDILTQYLDSYPDDEVASKELVFLQTR